MIFLFVTLFVLSLSVLLFELTLTRIFSIVLWYDYAFMAISVAFFGLGIGALLIHILKSKIAADKLPSKILQSIIVFAVSLPGLFVCNRTCHPIKHVLHLSILSGFLDSLLFCRNFNGASIPGNAQRNKQTILCRFGWRGYRHTHT